MTDLKDAFAKLTIQENHVRPEHKGNFRYKETEEIGSGTYGRVVRANDTRTNKEVAIKCVEIKTDTEETENEHLKLIFRELICLKINKHPNLLRLLDVYIPLETENASMFHKVYFVTELLERELGDMIRDKCVKFNQENISFIMYQICCAMNHLHKSKIVHRDLKSGNIAVKGGFVIKVLDFGMSRQQSEEMSLSRGAEGYRSPELVDRNPNYTEKVDIWSIGIIFSEIILRRLESFHDPSILAKLQNGTFNWKRHFGSDHFRNYSMPNNPTILKNINVRTARYLLSKLLVVDPTKRLSAEEAVRHPYLRLYWQEDGVNLMPEPIFNEIQNGQPSKDLIFSTIRAFAQKLHENETVTT